MKLTNHSTERWYNARDEVREVTVGDKCRSLGEALERSIRFLARNWWNHTTPVTIWECEGKSSYSASVIMTLEVKGSEIIIKLPQEEGK